MLRAMSVAGLILLGSLASILSGCGAGMAGMGAGCGMMGGHGDHGSHESSAAREESAACPVCGTKVVIDDGTPRATYHDTLYYFVSETHERRFLSDPERFLAESAPEAAPPETGHRHH